MGLFDKITKTAPVRQNLGRNGPPPCPKELAVEGRTLVHSGKGRAPGAEVYIDLADSKPTELYRAEVKATKTGYVLAEVVDNRALELVHVASGDIAGPGTGLPRPHDFLLLGNLEFHAGEPSRARFAWRLGKPASLASRPARLGGTVQRVHSSGKFGEIVTADGQAFFLHVSQLPMGVDVAVGQRVTFLAGRNDRGPYALDVHPA